MPCAPWAQCTEVVPAWRRSSQGRWGQARLQRCADWPLLTLFRSHTRPLGRDLEARNWSLFVCLCVLNAKGVALSGLTRSRPLEFGTVSSVDQENYKYRFRTHIVIHHLYYTLQSERCWHSSESINTASSTAYSLLQQQTEHKNPFSELSVHLNLQVSTSNQRIFDFEILNKMNWIPTHHTHLSDKLLELLPLL